MVYKQPEYANVSHLTQSDKKTAGVLNRIST